MSDNKAHEFTDQKIRWSRFSGNNALSILICAIFVSACLIVAFLPNPRLAEFNTKTSDAMVIGKTPRQIVLLLGQPSYKVAFPNGEEEYTYTGPNGYYCKMFFVGGVATRCIHWIK